MAVTKEEVLELSNEGLAPAEIGEKLGLSAQKVGSMLKAAKQTLVPEVLEGEVVSETITIRTAQEYMDYSEGQGRTKFGGEKGKKIKCSTEECRSYINAGWKPSLIMEKYQLDADDFQQLIWSLSKKELRDRPIGYDLKHDIFRG